MVKLISKSAWLFTLGMMMVSAAEAHTGHGSTLGFMHGFSHPLSGIDHILAMVAVGLFAAHLGGRAKWLVPSCFVVLMAFGGSMSISGFDLPFVELGIAASVIVLGALVALRTSMPTSMAMGIVGFFALFHGYAHGAEMPTDASGLNYAAGFMLATALLHITGIALGLGAAKLATGAHEVGLETRRTRNSARL